MAATKPSMRPNNRAGPTVIPEASAELEVKEAALKRDTRELVKLAKRLGSQQLLHWYTEANEELEKSFVFDKASHAAESNKLVRNLAIALVAELRVIADSDSDTALDLWDQMMARENCNKVVNSARRWLPNERLYT